MTALTPAESLTAARAHARERERGHTENVKHEAELVAAVRRATSARERSAADLADAWRVEESAYDVYRIDTENARAAELKRRESVLPSAPAAT